MNSKLNHEKMVSCRTSCRTYLLKKFNISLVALMSKLQLKGPEDGHNRELMGPREGGR